MVFLEVEQLSDIRSNDLKEFEPIVEENKDISSISKIKLEAPGTASMKNL